VLDGVAQLEGSSMSLGLRTHISADVDGSTHQVTI
jgi:hypothetical protein